LAAGVERGQGLLSSDIWSCCGRVDEVNADLRADGLRPLDGLCKSGSSKDGAQFGWYGKFCRTLSLWRGELWFEALVSDETGLCEAGTEDGEKSPDFGERFISGWFAPSERQLMLLERRCGVRP
jgi:hypothetical protein